MRTRKSGSNILGIWIPFSSAVVFWRDYNSARRRVRSEASQGRSPTGRGRTERFFSKKILLVWGGMRENLFIKLKRLG